MKILVEEVNDIVRESRIVLMGAMNSKENVESPSFKHASLEDSCEKANNFFLCEKTLFFDKYKELGVKMERKEKFQFSIPRFVVVGSILNR